MEYRLSELTDPFAAWLDLMETVEALCPQWPERPGMPYQRPPAYMAYPPFMEPHWRYYIWEPKAHYRGFHFWLDQF